MNWCCLNLKKCIHLLVICLLHTYAYGNDGQIHFCGQSMYPVKFIVISILLLLLLVTMSRQSKARRE